MAVCPICGPKCSACCAVLNAWGIVMMALLGVFFWIGSPGLIEDISFDEGEWKRQNYTKDFIMQKYQDTAINCWVAAAIYFVILIFSISQQQLNARGNYEMS